MNQNSHTQPENSGNGSTSRRVADALHEHIDQAAETGERLERKLHEKGERMHDKSRELNTTFSRWVQERPLAVVGGAVALGLLLGTLTRR